MRAAILVSITAGLAASALLWTGEIGLIVQHLLGKFAYSTSNAASLTLLVYLVLAQWAGVWRRISLGGLVAPALLGIALALGHGMNVWLTLRYLKEFELPQGVHLYHWQGAENSFTGLLHSHLGKTALAAGAQALGWSSPAYDTGRVFLAWVPGFAPWVLLTTFVCASLAALALVPTVWQRYAGHPAAITLYVLSSLACLKSMLDGGPLAHATPPALLALAWLVWPAELQARHSRGLAVLALLVLTNYLAFWIILSPERPMPALGSFLFPLAVYGWLGLVLTRRSLLWRGVLVAYLTLSLVWDATDNLLPYLHRQSLQCQAFSVLVVPGRVTPVSCAGESALATYRRLGDDPRKPHGTWITQTPSSGTQALVGSLIVIETRSNALQPPRGVAWQSIGLQSHGLGQHLSFQALARADLPPVFVSTQGNALSRNNYYVYLHQLSEALQRAGMSEFIVVPATGSNPTMD